MKRKEYENKRKALLDEASAMIDEGKMEEFEAKKKEVEDLDAQYEKEAQARANLRAIEENRIGANLEDYATDPEGARVAGKIGSEGETENPYNSTEYRRAFMNYVLKGKGIPEKFLNADQDTKTTDVGAIIPTTVAEQIRDKMEAIGMILPLVTTTHYKGGVKIPTSSVKPVATWVSEGAGSEKQKKTLSFIDFGYNKLRCAISVSLETDTMALPVFEKTFISNVADAMVKAKEETIVNGSGSGQPKGFLKETPEDGQTVSLSNTDKLTYKVLVDAEAALPVEYEADAVWFMTKKTFIGFVGMVDENKQPIARVNYGISGKPERVLLGRTVVVNNYMDSYADSVTADTIFAALLNPKDYIMNVNLDITVKRYEDNETDDQVTKAIELVDGKLVDKGSLVILKKLKPAASGGGGTGGK